VEDFVPGGLQSQDDPAPGDIGPPPGHIPAAEPRLDGLPTWEEAHTTSIPTVRHVPKAAREDWARVLAAVVSEVCAEPANMDKWLLLYMLPRCVLAARPRQLGATGQSAAKLVRAACRRWLDGEAVELWQEEVGRKKKQAKAKEKGKRGRKKKQAQTEELLRTNQQRNIDRAKMLVAENQLSRAAQALISRGMDMSSAEALLAMQEKHPQVEVAAPPAEENSTPPIVLTSRQVYEAVRSFKAGTAAGPSGLRAEHLKEAKGRGEGRGAAALGALTRLVNLMAAGKVPEGAAPFIFGANLFALLKKSGGLRPVAVGNILRRLTSKCIAYAVAGRAAQHLRPLQLGVGIRGGCEAVVHATRATLARPDLPPEEKWSLQVDFRNGFNENDRGHMMAEVRRHFPEVSAWVESSYGMASRLNFGSSTIFSTTGEHQGDPLAGLLFSLTLQPVLEMLQHIPGIILNCAFLDDVELVGTKEALMDAWDILEAEGVPRGLHLNQEKSLVSCPVHDPADQDPLERGVTRADDRGAKLLGAPLGNLEFQEEVLESRLATVEKLLQDLHLLEDPHVEYALLRSCYSFPKLAYTLRTVDTSQHKAFLYKFDAAVRAALERTLGTSLSPAQWDQASLPTGSGGLGLRRAAAHGAAAYLTSLGASGSLLQEIRGPEVEEEAPDTEEATRSLNDQLGDPLTYEEVRTQSQQAVSKLIDAEAASRLHLATTVVRDRARLNCVARDGAGDWLTALPSKQLGLHLRSGEFIFAVKHRLGLPVFREAGECPAQRCEAVSDVHGDHAISCAIGGERISKHNHVRDALFQAAQQAQLGPLKEPDGLLPGSDDRPADVLLPHWSNGRDVALDCTVVNATQATLVHRVAEDGSNAVRHAHEAKVRKYGDRCATEGIEFVPLAVDSFGGWHEVALETLTKLGRQLARVVGKPEEEQVRHLRQRLAVLLVRDNMAMLLSRSPAPPLPEVDGVME
jgi:hypothetical protein